MRGHIWTAFLNPIDLLPISSTFFPTTLFSFFFHLKPPLYLSYSPLLLILMPFLISGDIHPNPGPIDPCSICSRRVTWGNRSVQCSNCSLWVHLCFSGVSPADFCKIFPEHSWTCPMCPSSSQTPLPPSLSHPNPIPSFKNTPKSPSSPTNTHKLISSKIPPQNNSSPLITPSTLLITLPQRHLYFLIKSKIPSLLSHYLLSILPLLFETTFESYSGMLMGFAPVVLNLYNFSLKISTISS